MDVTAGESLLATNRIPHKFTQAQKVCCGYYLAAATFRIVFAMLRLSPYVRDQLILWKPQSQAMRITVNHPTRSTWLHPVTVRYPIP